MALIHKMNRNNWSLWKWSIAALLCSHPLPMLESSYAPFPKVPFLPFLLIDWRHVAKMKRMVVLKTYNNN
jgi:hypothetical protein